LSVAGWAVGPFDRCRVGEPNPGLRKPLLRNTW
jgi:hypothetical protein